MDCARSLNYNGRNILSGGNALSQPRRATHAQSRVDTCLKPPQRSRQQPVRRRANAWRRKTAKPANSLI